MIYGISLFILSSSFTMVGYVWIRDIKNTKAQAANAITDEDENSEHSQYSDEILSEYPNLIKKTA